MNKYVFLTAWMNGSEGAEANGVDGVKDQKDLLPQFLTDNYDVFAVEITAPNKEVATMYGRAAAWDENYTAHDTLSNTWLMSDIKGNVPDVETKLVVNITDNDTPLTPMQVTSDAPYSLNKKEFAAYLAGLNGTDSDD